MAEKSESKTEKKGNRSGLIPFAPGPDSRRGKGPPKGTGGRPPDKLLAMFEELGADPKSHTTLRKIMAGDGVTVTQTLEGAKILNVDIPSYLRAHQYVTERIRGKPAQTIQGPDGGPVQVQVINAPDLE